MIRYISRFLLEPIDTFVDISEGLVLQWIDSFNRLFLRLTSTLIPSSFFLIFVRNTASLSLPARARTARKIVWWNIWWRKEGEKERDTCDVVPSPSSLLRNRTTKSPGSWDYCRYDEITVWIEPLVVSPYLHPSKLHGRTEDWDHRLWIPDLRCNRDW